MSTITSRNSLVNEETNRYEFAAGATIALSALLFALGMTALFEFVTLTDPVAGVPIVSVLGGLLVLIGIVVLGLGVSSRLELTESTPDRSAGLVASFVFGGLWFGLGLVGWSGSVAFGRTLEAVRERLDAGSGWTERKSRRAMARVSGFGAGAMLVAVAIGSVPW